MTTRAYVRHGGPVSYTTGRVHFGAPGVHQNRKNVHHPEIPSSVRGHFPLFRTMHIQKFQRVRFIE